MAFSLVWDVSYEGTPPDSQDAALLGLRVRELKLAIRERADIEHAWGSGGGGRHKLPYGNLTARAALADLVDGMVFGRSNLPVLDMRQSAAFVAMLGYKWDTTANRTGFSPTGDLPTGLAWVDNDSTEYPIYFWNGAAWVRSYAEYGFVYDEQESTDTLSGADIATAGDGDIITFGVAPSVVVPATGTYHLNVDGHVTVQNNAANPRSIRGQLLYKIGAGAWSVFPYTGTGFASSDTGGTDSFQTIKLSGHIHAVSGAATYTFGLRVRADGSSCKLGGSFASASITHGVHAILNRYK